MAAPPDRPVLGTPAWRPTALEVGRTLAAGQRLPLRRLVRSRRRIIAVVDLAAGIDVLVIGVEPEMRLGHAALHRLLILFPGYLERLPGPQRAFAPGAAGNTASRRVNAVATG
jgi:hypothetical protein